MAAPYTLPALSRSMNADYLARVTVAEAAPAPGLAPSTPHRWLGDGFIADEHGAQADAGCTGSFPGMADRPLRWSVDPAGTVRAAGWCAQRGGKRPEAFPEIAARGYLAVSLV